MKGVYDLIFKESKPQEKKKDTLSRSEKSIVYPSGNSALDTLYESYRAGHISSEFFFRLYETGEKAAEAAGEENKFH